MRRTSPRQAQLLQNLRAVGVPLLEQPNPVHVEKLGSPIGTELLKVKGGFLVFTRLDLISTRRSTITRFLVRGEGIELRSWPLPACRIHTTDYCWHHPGDPTVGIAQCTAFPIDKDVFWPLKPGQVRRRYLVGFVSSCDALTGPAQVELEFGLREMGETYWFPLTCRNDAASVPSQPTGSKNATSET